MISILARRKGAPILAMLLATAAGGLDALAQDAPLATPTAAIIGRVTEDDGTPRPRATVVLTGPLPSGARRDTTTDQEGQFRVEHLLPGRYRIAVALPGLHAASDVEVEVAAGETVNAAIRLGAFAYDVAVEVVARSANQRLDVVEDSTSGQRQLSNRALTRLPLLAEQALEALPLFPGVVRGQDGLVSIGGTLPTDSAFMLNGADLIDTFSGRYRLAVPLEAVDNIQLHSGVFAAAYGENLGGVVDVRTSGGGDTWRTEIASPLPRLWFKDGQLSGIRRANPRLRISGPLIENRLHLSLAAGYGFDRERVRDVPNDEGDHERFESWSGVAQIDWRSGSRHDVRLMLAGMPDDEGYAGIGGLMPAPTTSSLTHHTGAVVAEHQFRVDERSFIQSLAQWNERSFAAYPTNPLPGPFLVIPDGYRGVAFHSEDRSTSHWQLKSTYTRALGRDGTRHVLQGGFDVHRLSMQGTYSNTPIEVLAEDGRPLERIEFLDGPGLQGGKWEASLFVQDRWRPSTRFWIDMGLRGSWDGATGHGRVAPRVGIAWDAFGNERTLFKASAGLLYRRVFLGEQLWDQQPGRLETHFDIDGTRRETRLTPTREADLDAPRALLASAEINHRFGQRFSARVRYTHRGTRKQIYFDRVPVTGAGVGTGPGAESLLLRSDGSATYQEIEFGGNLRIGGDGQLFASYVHSNATGELNTFERVAGERTEAILRRNESGPTLTDTPDRVVLWGSFDIPWRLRIAPLVEWRRGFPYSILREDQDYLGPANSARFPDYLSVDVNLTRAFDVFGQSFRAGLLVQNITGHFNPRDVIANVASDRFGAFLNEYGRRFRLRFSGDF